MRFRFPGGFRDLALSIHIPAPGGACFRDFQGIWSGFLDYKLLLTIFAAVFVAELGDKTQLATMLFAADREVSRLTVFIGASLALVLSSAIGVAAGGLVSNYISERHLHYIAGTGFIVIGIWTLVKA